MINRLTIGWSNVGRTSSTYPLRHGHRGMERTQRSPCRCINTAANTSLPENKFRSPRRTYQSRINKINLLSSVNSYSLSRMSVTLSPISVVFIHATMTLHATHRPTNHANCRVQRGGLAPLANQRLLLVDEQVIQDER